MSSFQFLSNEEMKQTKQATLSAPVLLQTVLSLIPFFFYFFLFLFFFVFVFLLTERINEHYCMG